MDAPAIPVLRDRSKTARLLVLGTHGLGAINRKLLGSVSTDLARHASLSTRQLGRRMLAELQTGPLEWLHQQRILRARELLERTDASVDQVAASCGLGTAATLRRHFHRATGVTPTAYRSMFRAAS